MKIKNKNWPRKKILISISALLRFSSNKKKNLKWQLVDKATGRNDNSSTGRADRKSLAQSPT